MICRPQCDGIRIGWVGSWDWWEAGWDGMAWGSGKDGDDSSGCACETTDVVVSVSKGSKDA